MSGSSPRRPLVVFAVLGMVAALLFAVAGTAGAMNMHEATFSACPGNAGIPDGGFSDVPAGSFFDDSVNCLKYYKVTTGVTPSTYGPSAEVTRGQMALFLARGAVAAGVVLKASPPDAGFTDIDGLSAEAQWAINALADAGIVKGKTATTYQPGAPVMRQHMALFLTRFLDKAVTGPGGVALSAAATTGAPFADIAGTTVEAAKAINQAWDLHIATGTTVSTFDPTGNVNRGQMALFLTRMYAHANVRPDGVNIQANPRTGTDIVPSVGWDLPYTVAVTTRTAGFSPMANALVDQWAFEHWDGAVLSSPLKTSGVCNIAGDIDGQIRQLGQFGGGTPCTIEIGDTRTDNHGNYVDSNRGGLGGRSYGLYAWSGAVASSFDADTTAYSMTTITPTPVANGYAFSRSPENGVLHFGDSATWTLQATMDGEPIAEAGWTFLISTAYADTDGVLVTHDPAQSMATDETGKATLGFAFTDLSPGPGDGVAFTVSVAANSGHLVPPSAQSYASVWLDEAPEATTVELATFHEFATISDSGSTTASVACRVYDQYGNPMPGVTVHVWSNRPSGLFGGVTQQTDANGLVTVQYQYVGSNPTIETIVADAAGVSPSVQQDFYWALEAATGDKTLDGVHTKIDAKLTAFYSFVAREETNGNLTAWTWKTGDTFKIGGVGVSRAAFEAEFEKPESTWIDVVSYSTTGQSEFDLGL